MSQEFRQARAPTCNGPLALHTTVGQASNTDVPTSSTYPNIQGNPKGEVITLGPYGSGDVWMMVHFDVSHFIVNSLRAGGPKAPHAACDFGGKW